MTKALSGSSPGANTLIIYFCKQGAPPEPRKYPSYRSRSFIGRDISVIQAQTSIMNCKRKYPSYRSRSFIKIDIPVVLAPTKILHCKYEGDLSYPRGDARESLQFPLKLIIDHNSVYQHFALFISYCTSRRNTYNYRSILRIKLYLSGSRNITGYKSGSNCIV